MPPKRKRAEADTAAERSTSTRSTRKTSRTIRGRNGAADVTEKAGTSRSTESAPKKTKTTGARSTNEARGSKSGARASRIDDQPLNSTGRQQSDDELDVHKKAQPVPPTKLEYSPQRAQGLFKSYADEDDPDVIGPGGIEKLCTEAGIPLEGAQTLILAWQFKAEEMAKLTRSEWLQGTDTLRISSLPALAMALKELDDLVIHDKEPITPDPSISSVKKRDGTNPQEPYNRVRYWQYTSNRNTTFAELYQFCFTLSKPPQSRNLDIDTAMALWSVLLTPRYPVITELIEFLNENGSFKGANKDIWNMVHEFCRTINTELSNYEADGAWPTMLDDFVTWKREKMGGSPKGA